MTDLGTLGGTYSGAYRANNLGQIVGYAHDQYDERRAFLWSNGAMMDLNDLIDPQLGWHHQSATGINNLGHIVGYGIFEGNRRAFLLVPEPSGISLFLCGTLAGVLCWRRKRRN